MACLTLLFLLPLAIVASPFAWTIRKLRMARPRLSA